MRRENEDFTHQDRGEEAMKDLMPSGMSDD
jgi:hypothetical protein